MRRHFGADAASRLEAAELEARELTNSKTATQTAVNGMYDRLNDIINGIQAVPDAADFGLIEERYQDYFVKNNLELTDSRIEAIHDNEKQIADIQSGILRSPKAAELWEEYVAPMANPSQEPGKIANSLAKIRTMCIGYMQNGNRYKGDKVLYNDIIYCLDFILTKKYNPSVTQYGNWYYWVVSTPATMTDIMVIMKGELPKELTERMEAAVTARIGNDFHYVWFGANRMYLAAVALKLGAAMEDGEYIHKAVYAVSAENGCCDTQPVNSVGDASNGYYWDGSYMFHNGIMYNTAYGRDQLSNTLRVMGYLKDTPWQIEQGLIDEMAARVSDMFEYVIYNGRCLDAAGGRSLGYGESYGVTIANSIEELSGYVGGGERLRLLSMAKQFKLDLGIEDELTKNEEIPARGRITKLKRYPIGDRLILQRPDYCFTLSMFSDRTKTFEAPNGDAMKAWYVSSGMTELLNGDHNQYNRDWWIAVDHYRLPGTTVDRVARSLTRYEGEMYNSDDRCGIIDMDELYGAAGMVEQNWNSSMTAKKSYFVFDNEIVCLGTGISRGTNNIETTVENRMLRDDMKNRVTIDGSELQNGAEKAVNGVKTVWFEGDKAGDDIGWYFPGGANLNVKKETRTGAEADMWLSDTDNKVTKSFFTMWYDHGVKPDSASYRYVILPGLSERELQDYSENPDIEITDETDDVHSVRDNRLGVAGYCFWNKRGGSGEGVSTDGNVILMTKESNSRFELSLTDPTFKAERDVNITFKRSVSDISECDERIRVISKSPLKIRVNLKGINGRKISLKAVE